MPQNSPKLQSYPSLEVYQSQQIDFDTARVFYFSYQFCFSCQENHLMQVEYFQGTRVTSMWNFKKVF